MGLTCNGLGKQCLTCTGRSYQKGPFWQLGTYLNVLARIVKEIDDLDKEIERLL